MGENLRPLDEESLAKDFYEHYIVDCKAMPTLSGAKFDPWDSLPKDDKMRMAFIMRARELCAKFGKDNSGMVPLDVYTVENVIQESLGRKYLSKHIRIMAEAICKTFGAQQPPKERKVSLEEIDSLVEQFENEGKYGRNFCKRENKPRSPNSIGCCDYCGGDVRLQRLSEAILSLLNATEGR